MARLLFLFLMLVSLGKAEELHYLVRPIFLDERLKLEVTLQFNGNASGLTEIMLPSDGEEAYRPVTGLQCCFAIENTEETAIKRISHPPNEKIELTYHVVAGIRGKKEWHHYPILEKQYFHCFGDYLWAHPRLDMEQKIHVIFDWENFPNDWVLANSFGIQSRHQDLQLSLPQLKSTVYIGGDFEIVKRQNIVIAARGKLRSTLPGLLDKCEKIISTQRQFWQDFEDPPYLITLLPLEQRGDNIGRGLFQSFGLLVDEQRFDQDQNWAIQMLSHEYFHNWNGWKISPQKPDEFHWFSEGFTDYYAIVLSHRAGLITDEKYADSFHQIRLSYNTSPVRNATNEQIAQSHSKNYDLWKLPYLRGALLAARWNEQIRKQTGNVHSLDDVMHGLLKLSQKQNRPITPEDVIEQAAIFLDSNAQNDVHKFIFQGETIPP